MSSHKTGHDFDPDIHGHLPGRRCFILSNPGNNSIIDNFESNPLLNPDYRFDISGPVGDDFQVTGRFDGMNITIIKET
jgi:hypothetical protein